MSQLVPVADVEKIRSRIEKWSIPEPNSGCWLWVGSIGNSGYGKTRFDHNHDVGAHRASYLGFRGPIPDGMCVLHSCDVRSCVNPNHLFLGTKKENSVDMVRKGRNYSPSRDKTHCPQGHEYSGLNSQRRRICRTCQNNASLAHYHRSKQK